MAIRPDFDPTALSLAAPNFDDAVARAISMYQPQGDLSLGNPGVAMPNMLEAQGPIPDPNVPFNIMSVLGGQQPQDNTINPGGLRDAMGRVIGKIQSGEDLANEQRGRLQNLNNRMQELLIKRGGLMPEQAAQAQQDPQEALIAGLIALAGKAGGARNAGQAFNSFMGQRQGQIAGQNAQAQQALNQEYSKRKQELDAQHQVLDMEFQDANQQLSGLQKQQSDLYGEYSDLAQSQATTDRETMKVGSREYIAQLGDDTKRFIALLNDDTKRNQDGLELASQYQAWRGMGLSHEDAVGQVSAANNLKIAQAGLTDARKKTEDELRIPRRDKILEDIKNIKFDNETDRKKMTASAEKHAASIDNDFEEARFKRGLGIIEADIELLTADKLADEADLAAAEALAESYANQLAQAINNPAELARIASEMKKVGDDISRLKNNLQNYDKQIALKTKDKAQAKRDEAGKALPRNGATPASRGTTQSHTAFRSEIAKAFPGMKLEQFSGKPRNMRGAGNTTSPSRHNDGRAIDAYYRSASEKKKLADWAIANGATLIIDYVGKRNWRPGKGWYPAPKNDSAHKHLHIEKG